MLLDLPGQVGRENNQASQEHVVNADDDGMTWLLYERIALV